MSDEESLPVDDELVGLERGLETFRASPEFQGPVESFDGHDPNEHFALLYETHDEWVTAVVPFVRDGLECGEHCLYVLDNHTEAEVREVLRDAGIDVTGALESGALTFSTVGETYLRNGTFDPDEMLAFYADVIAATEATGYTGLRVSAETGWVRNDETDLEDFMAYESRVNDLFSEENAIALCQYDCAALPAELLCDVIRTHLHLVYNDTVCHNFYYVPPEEFFGPKQPEREADRMMATLLDRTEAKSKLETRQSFLRKHNEITADPALSFEGKLQRLFDLGCEWFDLELGAMTLVEPDTDRFEIEYTSSGHEYFGPGFEMPLSETYCEATIDGTDVVSVSDPVGDGFGGRDVYTTLGFQVYLGVHIEVEAARDRTFFFAASEPRASFSDEERTVLRLMARWVTSELERQRREQFHRRLYEITADPGLTFEEQLQALFELGCDRFGLELGGLARIDPASDLFEVEAVSHEYEDERNDENENEQAQERKQEIENSRDYDRENRFLVPGTQVDLSETYCRLMVDTEQTLGVTDPVGDGFEETVAYREFGVDAYLGTRIELENELDRTFFFVSTDPRDREFSAAERTFHHLMAQWIKRGLEHRHHERALEASNERLEQFAYAASHDLQEPLRMVSSYLQLIEDRYGDALDTEGEEFLEFAVDGANRMNAMIEGLLEYSRIEMQGDPFEPVELDVVFEDVCEDLQLKIEEREAKITVSSLPRVEGDASQLRQLFQNLLDNALEYTDDEPPRVHVSSERSGSDCLVSVRDEGIGIDMDDTDRVFEVFERHHTREEYDGTGIGLALCERIVERHGGTIWVDSSPGDGSVFSFTLPAAPGSESDEAQVRNQDLDSDNTDA